MEFPHFVHNSKFSKQTMSYIPGQKAYLFNNPNQYKHYPKQKLQKNRPVPVMVGAPMPNNNAYMAQQNAYSNNMGYDYSMPYSQMQPINPTHTNVISSQNSVAPLNTINSNVTPITNAVNAPNATLLNATKQSKTYQTGPYETTTIQNTKKSYLIPPPSEMGVLVQQPTELPHYNPQINMQPTGYTANHLYGTSLIGSGAKKHQMRGKTGQLPGYSLYTPATGKLNLR